MKRAYLIILYTIVINQCFGQIQRTEKWYFGNYAGLDFSSGSPQSILNSAMGAFEGCSSISDSLGNLLFYTNGGGSNGNHPLGGVWNKNNQLMPNGNLPIPGGCNSSQQGAIIVPRPGTTKQYYLFTLDCVEYNLVGGLRYSLIDMNLDGGLGDIDTSEKNIPLVNPTNECIAAVKHLNGSDYWIITSKDGTDEFYIYLIDNSGVQPPLVYSTGFVQWQFGSPLEISPIGDRLFHRNIIYDFDAATGSLSANDTINYHHFKSFSANGKFLYAANSSGGDIHQYDVTAPIPMETDTIIGTVSGQYGDFQLAPDGNIYIPIRDSSFLAAIECANDSFPLCSFVQESAYLGGQTSSLGLPHFVSSFLFSPTKTCIPVGYSLIEPSNEIIVFPNPSGGMISVNFPATTNSIQIFNSFGQLILTSTVTGRSSQTFTIETDGIYFASVQTDKENITKKIIVHK